MCIEIIIIKINTVNYVISNRYSFKIYFFSKLKSIVFIELLSLFSFFFYYVARDEPFLKRITFHLTWYNLISILGQCMKHMLVIFFYKIMLLVFPQKRSYRNYTIHWMSNSLRLTLVHSGQVTFMSSSEWSRKMFGDIWKRRVGAEFAFCNTVHGIQYNNIRYLGVPMKFELFPY